MTQKKQIELLRLFNKYRAGGGLGSLIFDSWKHHGYCELQTWGNVGGKIINIKTTNKFESIKKALEV